MIAVDTNILVYAHRRDSQFHARAKARVTALAENERWALAWSTVHEFLAIVTNTKIFKVPTPPAAALAQARAWLKSPGLVMLAEGEGYFEVLAELLGEGKIQGAKVHDARIAALCLFHGVAELLTADRDFSRFAALKCRNPL